jgi:cytidine deaminase
MKEIQIQTPVFVYTFDTLPEQYKQLIVGAKKQTQQAYAPYSEFQVGAAVLLANGEIIGGNNQENAAYPSGICAERVAVFAANSQYPTQPVRAVAIAAYTNGAFLEKPISPCGSCRQVLLETENRFSTPMDILLYGETAIYLIKKASSLLPLNFSKDSLFLP